MLLTTCNLDMYRDGEAARPRGNPSTFQTLVRQPDMRIFQGTGGYYREENPIGRLGYAVPFLGSSIFILERS
jgi:hypothetical protein